MFRKLTQLFRKKRTPVSIPPVAPLLPDSITSDDRLRIIAWLDSEDTQFVLRLLESSKPSVFVNVATDPKNYRYALERRALQLQGWESCRNSIQALRYTQQEIKTLVEETFPDQD